MELDPKINSQIHSITDLKTKSRFTVRLQLDYSSPDDLVKYSPKDSVWDEHRATVDAVGQIYGSAPALEFERYSVRLGECSGQLLFGWQDDLDTGETKLKLQSTRFCRVRHCPVCQWRRSLMWQARFLQSLPEIADLYPSSRWIFLTLTVRNCEIQDLKAQLKELNLAWQRLLKRKEFTPVQGWVRSTEVTRGKDGSAHPHFHCLLMVPPSMLSGRSYITQARWTELWQDCARLTYTPVVDVRAVKPKGKESAKDDPEAIKALLRGAISETLKYSVKPSDMTADPDWFLELTRQVHKMRFIATGGALKNVLKIDEETNEDLITVEDENLDPKVKDLIAFDWSKAIKKYKKAKPKPIA